MSSADPLVISSLRGVPANQTLALLGSEPDAEPVNDSLRVKRTSAKAGGGKQVFRAKRETASLGSCSRLKRYIKF